MAIRGTILIGDPAVPARAARGPRLARRTVERSALLALVWLLILMFAREMVITWGLPDPDLLDPFADANTYLAAGERLNDGHPLYALQPGDRPVLLVGDYPVPLFSPPPIAAIWRPLAIVPFGFAAWIVATWVAVLGTVTYLVLRIGLPAAVVIAVLAFPIGEQLVAGNVAAFFPAALVWSWRYRTDRRVGFVLGGIAALKLTPLAMGGWLFGMSRFRGVGRMAIGAGALAAIGLVGAGMSAYVVYLEITPTIPTSSLSLASRSGIPWLSTAALIGGTGIAALLWRRPAVSFVAAVVTLVVASPALYPPTLALLMAALAPLLPADDASSGGS